MFLSLKFVNTAILTLKFVKTVFLAWKFVDTAFLWRKFVNTRLLIALKDLLRSSITPQIKLVWSSDQEARVNIKGPLLMRNLMDRNSKSLSGSFLPTSKRANVVTILTSCDELVTKYYDLEGQFKVNNWRLMANYGICWQMLGGGGEWGRANFKFRKNRNTAVGRKQFLECVYNLTFYEFSKFGYKFSKFSYEFSTFGYIWLR